MLTRFLPIAREAVAPSIVVHTLPSNSELSAVPKQGCALAAWLDGRPSMITGWVAKTSISPLGVWRNGSASDSRSEGWEFESLCPHICKGFPWPNGVNAAGQSSISPLRVWRGRVSDSRPEGWEIKSLCPHICKGFLSSHDANEPMEAQSNRVVKVGAATTTTRTTATCMGKSVG